MGKFTQSVKRMVQEVKEDGTQGKRNDYYLLLTTPIHNSTCLQNS